MKEKLQELAQVAEIASAIAIVASLIFVGLQIQQNTEVAKMEAYNYWADRSTANQFMLSSDPIITPLIVRVNSGDMPEDFTDVENFRIQTSYTALLRIWEGLFRSVDLGLLPPSALDVVGQGGAFKTPYFRVLWLSVLRSTVSDDFAAFLESLSMINE